MTPDEIRARLDEIRGLLKEIDTEYAGAALPESKRDEFTALVGERKEKERLLEELEVRRQVIAAEAESEDRKEAGFQVSARVGKTSGEDIYDLSTIRSSFADPSMGVRELKDRALMAVERGNYVAQTVSKEDAQTQVEHLLRNVDDKDGTLARRIVETGSPLYERAFGKALEGRSLSDAETRALNTTAATGGYNIPFTLDPTVIHTSNYSVNPYRAIARVEQIVTNAWHGVSTAGASVSRHAEAEEVAEATVEFAQPEAKPTRADFFIPFSIEIGQDWAGLQAEMTRIVQEAKDDEEASSFSTGAGTGVFPQGVFIGGTESVNTAATATFAVGDVYKAEQELPPRYRPRASWVAKRNAYNSIRQFDTAGGAQLWTENLQRGLANQVPGPGNTGYNLLGYGASECSAAPYATTSGGTIAIIGDFSRFLIVDRIGMDVEIVPQLFGASRKPTGQRGFLAIWRNTSKVLDPNAFRKLKAL